MVHGGKVPEGSGKGYFLEPTIFSNVTDEMRIAKEEILGPVVVVQTFKTEDEAVRRANNNDYGLIGSVWSGDLERGLRLAGQIRTGTGSAQGIGKRYAEMLVAEGAKVVLADVLVNNAVLYAGYIHYSMSELPVDYWEKFMKVNVTSMLLTTQAVIPAMTAQGKGKIINQSSTAGALSGNVYGLTKLAVQGLTVAFARELAVHNVNVNCIGPGVTNTRATLDHYPDGKMDQFVEQLHLIKRAATPDDHGKALIHLASDESDMMTGQILRTDGGAFLLPV